MGPKFTDIFVCYKREFVITVIVITEFDCINVIPDKRPFYIPVCEVCVQHFLSLSYFVVTKLMISFEPDVLRWKRTKEL